MSSADTVPGAAKSVTSPAIALKEVGTVAADMAEEEEGTAEGMVVVEEVAGLVDRPATLVEAMATCLEIALRVRNGT